MQPAQNTLQMTPQIQAALENYGVDTADVVEAHPQVFWDYQAYPAAGQLNFNFFQNVPGQNGYTQATTNMPAPGQFPNPQNFLWTATEIVFFSGQKVSFHAAAADNTSQADDYNAVMLFGLASYYFKINTKTYLQAGPLGSLPAQFGMDAAVAAAAYDLGAATEIILANQTPYGEKVKTSGQLIESNYQLVGNIQFDALVPTPSTIIGRIGVRLHGIWYQLAQ